MRPLQTISQLHQPYGKNFQTMSPVPLANVLFYIKLMLTMFRCFNVLFYDSFIAAFTFHSRSRFCILLILYRDIKPFQLNSSQLIIVAIVECGINVAHVLDSGAKWLCFYPEKIKFLLTTLIAVAQAIMFQRC